MEVFQKKVCHRNHFFPKKKHLFFSCSPLGRKRKKERERERENSSLTFPAGSYVQLPLRLLRKARGACRPGFAPLVTDVTECSTTGGVRLIGFFLSWLSPPSMSRGGGVGGGGAPVFFSRNPDRQKLTRLSLSRAPVDPSLSALSRCFSSTTAPPPQQQQQQQNHKTKQRSASASPPLASSSPSSASPSSSTGGCWRWATCSS